MEELLFKKKETFILNPDDSVKVIVKKRDGMEKEHVQIEDENWKLK